VVLQLAGRRLELLLCRNWLTELLLSAISSWFVLLLQIAIDELIKTSAAAFEDCCGLSGFTATKLCWSVVIGRLPL
jgi:hypothetical protein